MTQFWFLTVVIHLNSLKTYFLAAENNGNATIYITKYLKKEIRRKWPKIVGFANVMGGLKYSVGQKYSLLDQKWKIGWNLYFNQYFVIVVHIVR